MIRWLTWIYLFNFNIQHVFDKKYIATNKFSRKSCESSNNIDEVHKRNIDNLIDDQFNYVWIYLMQVNENDDKQFLKNEYFEKF